MKNNFNPREEKVYTKQFKIEDINGVSYSDSVNYKMSFLDVVRMASNFCLYIINRETNEIVFSPYLSEVCSLREYNIKSSRNKKNGKLLYKYSNHSKYDDLLWFRKDVIGGKIVISFQDRKTSNKDKRVSKDTMKKIIAEEKYDEVNTYIDGEVFSETIKK